MRPIGLVAAAAAGLIAPLAIAMPALAGTDSPLLGGMTSIVDGDNGGPDNGDNGGPDNGDNGGSDDGDNQDGDNGDNYDGDNGPDNGDNGNDDWDDGDPDVNVYASGSEASGDVSFIVDVNDGGPFDEYQVESPSLDAGCETDDLSGATMETDRFGHLNVAGDALNCIPGNYKIAVFQTGGGEETYYGEVNVH